MDKRPSETWPNMCHVEVDVTTTNDGDQTVLTMTGLQLVEQRDG